MSLEFASRPGLPEGRLVLEQDGRPFSRSLITGNPRTLEKADSGSSDPIGGAEFEYLD